MPTILITGASRGLGLEFVRQYARAGWRVLATVRDPLSGKAASDAGAEIYVADVADEDSIRRLAAATAAIPLDLLLNNAGIYGEKQSFGSVSPESFLQVMRVNVVGPLKMAEAFAGRLVGRKIIASVSSMMGSIEDTDVSGSYAYRSSKAALNMVTKCLSVELAPEEITVISLSPGWVQTDMGGADAPLTPTDAIGGMRKVLDHLTFADSGKFFHFDGRELPW